MNILQHTAFYISADVDINWLINEIKSNKIFNSFFNLSKLHGEIFSTDRLQEFIKEEVNHDNYLVTTINKKSLSTSSNGEQRLALLQYIFVKEFDYIIAENIYDSLDKNVKQNIENLFIAASKNTLILQIISRKNDCLTFINQIVTIKKNVVVANQTYKDFCSNPVNLSKAFSESKIPEALYQYHIKNNCLIKLTNVSVKFDDKQILQNICWQINKGEFWHLYGPNGSGKTTILSMIMGDNSKAYGQNIILFGNKKGSGETVWSIKEKIGFFASYMLTRYDYLHTAEQMILGGYFDSVGLYQMATDMQKQIAIQWLQLIDLINLKDKLFRDLLPVQQRLILLARAMVKHPPLLILDEPTSNLDDEGADLFCGLVNKISIETNTAIIYVSHRDEKKLNPKYIFNLIPTKNGSEGEIKIKR